MLKVNVHGSSGLGLEYAMRNGAPNTSPLGWEQIKSMQKEFEAEAPGYAHKEVLLYCFGEFVHQSRVEAFVTHVKATHKLKDMGIRTMLAVGDDHRALCQERGTRRMRFVSLARKVRHLNLWHVPTLHQEDRTDCVTNALMLEPYDFCWSAEHVFGFERNAR